MLIAEKQSAVKVKTYLYYKPWRQKPA